MSVTLVMFTKSGERRDFEIPGEKAVIGRVKECDIQIGLGVVSRRHCELMQKGEKLVVRDLGSSNGTYVNNKRVQQAEVAAGETLTIGPVIFTVVINGKPREIKPIRTMIGKSKSPDKSAAEKSGAAEKQAPRQAPLVKMDDTGGVDLDDSAELEIFGSSAGVENPLAELEELSKQKRSED